MMTERVQELARQARAWAEVSYKNQNDQFTSHWDTPIGYTVSQFFEQKFAELIVAECMEQVWFSRVTTPIGNISEVIKERMKQHFGVE